MNFTTKFKFGDQVIVDGCPTLMATVIGFCFHTHGYQIQISWWNNGTLVEQWIADWRVERNH